jgi:Periplasmic binding protein
MTSAANHQPPLSGNNSAIKKIPIMPKNLFLLAFFLTAFLTNANAQADSVKNVKCYKVGIFAPLYLDSAFAGNTYRYSNKTFPKFTLPGLDFVQGAQVALDSLPLADVKFETYIYDSKSYFQNIPFLISNKQLDSLDILIGSVKDLEFTQLASFAKQKNIPFISATHPNDGGTIANPFMVIVNPTLKSHCEAIYSFLLQNHGTDKIYLVRRPGAQENSVEQQFKRINEPDGKPLLHIEVINLLTDDFSVLTAKLDSNRNSIIIGGSLNEGFANNLATFAQSVSSSYNITLVGMPNWDGFNSLLKNKKLKDFPVFYTSPFFNNKWDSNSKKIKEVYLRKYKGVPSDLSYKGFEITLQFTKLLGKYPDDLMSHLNDYPYKIFSDYKFRPVFLKKDSEIPDYFENKNLYFVKILNGNYSRAW